MNIFHWGTKTLLLALIAFLIAVLLFVGEIMTRDDLFTLNYSLLAFSAGCFLLAYRRYELKKPILSFAKSPIITKIIFPLLIIINLGLIIGYFFVEKTKLFQNNEGIKAYFGIYAIIFLFWIGSLFLLRKQFKW